MPEFLKPVLVPIHSAGWPFIAIFAVVTLALGWLWTPFFVIGGILTAWCTYFFRDPVRHTPTREGLIISPADGVVQMITDAVPPSELEMPIEALTRVSIFMNVFDVHVKPHSLHWSNFLTGPFMLNIASIRLPSNNMYINVLYIYIYI